MSNLNQFLIEYKKLLDNNLEKFINKTLHKKVLQSVNLENENVPEDWKYNKNYYIDELNQKNNFVCRINYDYGNKFMLLSPFDNETICFGYMSNVEKINLEFKIFLYKNCPHYLKAVEEYKLLDVEKYKNKKMKEYCEIKSMIDKNNKQESELKL